ncbi:MAG: co-chaperone DjlA [Gammaproteobacteria bacterium]|nr:co-chaperone DjlA [Gammaproteobacteria bacterium]
MNWWGKLIGGAFGFMMGGPIGALLGAALGHNFDKGLTGVMKDASGQAGETERVQSAFFAATFSIMGYIAKADGRVSELEITAANHVMSQMMLNPEQRQVAKRLFNEGRQPQFDPDAVLAQFKQECHRRSNLMQMFLEIQIATVLADGVIDQKERSVLYHVGKQLGFSANIIAQLTQMAQAQQHYAHEPDYKRAPSASDIKYAYKVLGVSESADDTEVKKAYRRLMNQHHPDKLVSKGLPDEMMKLATEKTQDIKRAYEQIKRARKL